MWTVKKAAEKLSNARSSRTSSERGGRGQDAPRTRRAWTVCKLDTKTGELYPYLVIHW